MKTLFAFGLCAVSSVSVIAQSRGLTRPLGLVPPVTSRALGGTFVSPVISRPLGGVALPTFGSSPTAKRAGARNAYRYVGPVYYTPNAYDSYSDLSSYPPPAPVTNSNAAQPIIVNQYFISRGSSIPDVNAEPREAMDAPPANPGDPLVEPQSYYLIAYKDNSMYSALAYWVEGDTLHYVTTQNMHNQASLNLIDVDRTYKLNSDRSVPFAVPGK